jgi:hypothetical protein
MKNPLADLYQQVLLNEAEKHNLQNPSSDEVGNLKPSPSKQSIFGSTPKAVEGAEKAKLQKGPAYKETTGSASAPKASSSSFKGSAPAKETKVEEGEEMEDTEVDPTEEEDEEETENKKPFKKEMKQENFTMSAFETLFKKTLTEEIDEVPAPEMESDEELNLDTEEGEEEMEEELEDEEEADLVSDLRELQDKLAAILSKLEDVAEEESEEESEDYTEEEFDEEFGEEEEGAAMKESMDKPKPLNSSKGKALMSKKNKVGRLSAKGGKANGGSLKHEPKPKALGDKKGVLQKGKPEVKSSVKKGDFIK